MNNLKPNKDIRDYAEAHGVPLWRVSERCGFAYSSNFSAYLRKKLSDDEKQELFSIIDELAAELYGKGGEEE